MFAFCAFIGRNRNILRNKILSILTIIICPTVYFGNLSCPVSVSRANRCCPFQRIGIPGFRSFTLRPFQML